MSDAERKRVGELINDGAYVRERRQPNPGDQFYLHLSDLKLMMEQVGTCQAVKVIDLGCGGSPYRDMFQNASYKRADIAGVSDIDYVIQVGSGAMVDEVDGSFDLVISSQVLEHVPSPAEYLAECYRLLKAGGTVIVTTHGFFEDHGCPEDYRRWTGDGLARDLTDAGFVVERVWKMTTGPRAVWFLMQQCGMLSERGSVPWFILAPWRILMRKARPFLDRCCDRIWSSHRVVLNDGGDHRMYIGVGVQARKQ